MRYICHDCGNEIPGDMDFCPRCGCMRSRATPVDDQGMPESVCPSCGAPRSAGDVFCGSCGAKLPESVQTYVAVRPGTKGTLALMLAIVPGFFNVFGLGHLVMRQWSRGLMYLAISVVVWYVNGWSMFSANIMMSLLVVALFFVQMMDIFRVVYMPGAR